MNNKETGMGSARDGAVGSEDHSPGFTQMQPEATSIRLFTVNPLLSPPSQISPLPLITPPFQGKKVNKIPPPLP